MPACAQHAHAFGAAHASNCEAATHVHLTWAPRGGSPHAIDGDIDKAGLAVQVLLDGTVHRAHHLYVPLRQLGGCRCVFDVLLHIVHLGGHVKPLGGGHLRGGSTTPS